jgi:hypothetical protein
MEPLVHIEAVRGSSTAILRETRAPAGGVTKTYTAHPTHRASPYGLVGLLVLLRPKSKRQVNATGSTAHNKRWVLTGRIDFIESALSRRACARAALGEARTVLVLYHAQRKLLMTANFVVSAPSETSRNGQGEKVELKDIANGQGLAVKPVAAEATNEAS